MQAAKKRKVTATRSVDATGSAAPAAAAAAAVSSGTTKPVDVQLVRHHSMFCARRALVALVALTRRLGKQQDHPASCTLEREVSWRGVGTQKSMPTSQLKLVFDIINSERPTRSLPPSVFCAPWGCPHRTRLQA